MNRSDTQECMTVEKDSGNNILCLLCCWAFWCPQRAGSSMDVTSAWLPWTHPRLPEEDHQGFKWDFLLASTTVLHPYEPAVNYCHLCKSVPNTGSQVRVREVNSEPMQNQNLVYTLTNIANSTNKWYNPEMWVHQGWSNSPVSTGPLRFQLWREWYDKLQKCKRNLRWVVTSHTEVQREKQGKYFWKVPCCIYWPHQIRAMVLCQNLKFNMSSRFLLMYGCANTDVGRRQQPVSHCTTSCRSCLSTVGIPLHWWSSVAGKNHPSSLACTIYK